jgi:hypothetical protein
MPKEQPAIRRRTLVGLALSAVVFLGWIGYLAFLVYTTHHPRSVVLSRPQLLNADLDVVARVNDPSGPVTVRAVEWVRAGLQPPAEGESLRVTNLKQCLVDNEETRSLPPGEYLLPLKRVGDDFEVAPTAPSPGYPPPDPVLPRPKDGPPRIYRATPAVLKQLEQLHASEERITGGKPPSPGRA